MKKKMMKSNIIDAETYLFEKGEKILIDANVWLSLFPAPSDPRKKDKDYSEAFKNLVGSGCCPMLDPLILSEYLNRYLRIEQSASNIKNYKDFRKSPAGQTAIIAATVYAKEILKACELHSIPPSELNIDQVLNDFQTTKIDFNDALFLDICKKKSFKLMTHDGDFYSSDATILTKNQKLLQKRK